MADKNQPAQHQDQQPGIESKMTPQPTAELSEYQGSNKLRNKIAMITGGDSGIGRAVAIAFAKEGADIILMYLNEKEDAQQTQLRIEEIGRRCMTIAGDIGDETFCQKAVEKALAEFNHIHILVNNAAEQHPQDDFLQISKEQIQRTFQTNIFGMFYLTQAVIAHMQSGDTIINSTSVTAYRGSKHLIDYATTKGAIVSFTRSLAAAYVDKNIRVNAVAPGPVWTPLIPASFPAEKVEKFGSQAPMGRAAQPAEIAPSYVFLASADSSFMTGQVLHPNGGEIVGG